MFIELLQIMVFMVQKLMFTVDTISQQLNLYELNHTF